MSTNDHFHQNGSNPSMKLLTVLTIAILGLGFGAAHADTDPSTTDNTPVIGAIDCGDGTAVPVGQLCPRPRSKVAASTLSPRLIDLGPSNEPAPPGSAPGWWPTTSPPVQTGPPRTVQPVPTTEPSPTTEPPPPPEPTSTTELAPVSSTIELLTAYAAMNGMDPVVTVL